MNFRELHYQTQPLLLANAWDAQSAQIAQECGYQAVGTSSAAIASSMGYADGEQITLDELLAVVRQILTAVSIPVTVDIEAGYGKTAKAITATITRLVEMGVAGINIEDSIVDAYRGRLLTNAQSFAEKITQVCDYLCQHQQKPFINLRTDAYLCLLPGQAPSQSVSPQTNPLTETLSRISAYRDVGADGLFVPGVISPSDISALVQASDLPVNVMCMPALPDFNTLARLGVKRISMGNFVHLALQEQLKASLMAIGQEQSFASLF
jgi:2-methylisocitrate lyase-like PEP mutase family enzyme